MPIQRHAVLPLVAVWTALSGMACSSSGRPSSSTDAGADGGSGDGSDAGGSSGSSGGSGSSSGSGSGSGGGACGLALFPPDFPSSCQTVADHFCCTQEQACAANADCINLVKCANACPAPRQDSCVNACGPADAATPPGAAELNAIADCSSTAPDGGWPASCDWP
ncbi:MAG: hypothetical protein ACLP1X_23790 [Polyangiaceae bacterium]|jgi:hypothetical protein